MKTQTFLFKTNLGTIEIFARKAIAIGLAALLIAAFFVPNIHPTLAQETLTVDDDPGADFTTIQAAIDTAAPGDTIIVSSGNYQENLVISTDNLALEGEAGATIDGGVIGEHTITLTNIGNVSISGFSITNGTDGVHSTSLLPGGTISISGNTITDGLGRGIYLDGIPNSLIDISSNQINGFGNSAIFASSDASATDGDINITGNILSGNDGQGILVDSLISQRLEVITNTVTGNVTDGIHLGETSGAEVFISSSDFSHNQTGLYLCGGTTGCTDTALIVDANVVSDNDLNGIFVGHLNGNGSLQIWTDNVVERNATAGIFLKDIQGEAFATVILNSINNNGGPGIVLGDITNVSIEDNSLVGNKNGIIIESSATLEGSFASGNSISGSTFFGIQNSNTTEFDARNNWWGDPLGPATSENESEGDSAVGAVLFEPWCTDEGCSDTGSAGEIASLDLSLGSTSISVGSETMLTVTAEDSEGNAVLDNTTAVELSGANITFDGLSGPITFNLVDGVATTSISSSVSGTSTILAKIDGTVFGEVDIVFTEEDTGDGDTGDGDTGDGEVGSITSIDLALDLTELNVGESATLTLVAKDDAGNVIDTDATITLTSGASVMFGGQENPTTINLVNGMATTTVSSNFAEAHTITARIDGEIFGQIDIAFVANSGDVTSLDLGLEPVELDVSQSSTLTITARDGEGNVVDTDMAITLTSGATLMFDGEAGSKIINLVNGTATVEVSESTAAAHTITARIDGVSFGQIDIVFTGEDTGDGGDTGDTGDGDTGGGITLDNVTLVSALAEADGTFLNGWHYTFNITIEDMNETDLYLRFEDWVNSLNASSTIATTQNMRLLINESGELGGIVGISEDNIINGVGPVNSYALGNLYMEQTLGGEASAIDVSNIDNSLAEDGRQVQFDIFIRIPVGTDSGFYSTTFGINAQASGVLPE